VDCLESFSSLDLDLFLDQKIADGPGLVQAAAIIREIASAAIELSTMVARGLLSGPMSASRGSTNNDGDVQKELDIVSDGLLTAALKRAPVAVMVSEELPEPLILNPGAPFVVAIDPLDGSSNIDANISIGTIFSILPALPDAVSSEAHFLRPGRSQIGAGFVVYGPQTSLVFSLGNTTDVFILDKSLGKFFLVKKALKIPNDSVEYAINGSNYRHWDPPVRAFVDDCIQGVDGPLKRNHNTRWVASLVAEAYRIMLRGGVFLYPGDQRTGYRQGRLRMLYEASPIAFLVENAGGSAIDCYEPILNITPAQIHSRTPLVFGSSDLVGLVFRYHKDPQFSAEHAPLFGKRGLMRF
jgi:fructose-1,6-bisphosphatase I